MGEYITKRGLQKIRECVCVCVRRGWDSPWSAKWVWSLPNCFSISPWGAWPVRRQHKCERLSDSLEWGRISYLWVKTGIKETKGTRIAFNFNPRNPNSEVLLCLIHIWLPVGILAMLRVGLVQSLQKKWNAENLKPQYTLEAWMVRLMEVLNCWAQHTEEAD